MASLGHNDLIETKLISTFWLSILIFQIQVFKFTISFFHTQYSGRIRSIPCLLMPCPLDSPGHPHLGIWDNQVFVIHGAEFQIYIYIYMMTSSNENIFHVTGHRGQWHGALMFSLICAWANGSVKNQDTGDLRRHRAHYDANVMTCSVCARNGRNTNIYIYTFLQTNSAYKQFMQNIIHLFSIKQPNG